VLEALLKRVDGLERRLKDEKKAHSPNDDSGSVAGEGTVNGDPKPKRPQLDTSTVADETAVYSPDPIRLETSSSGGIGTDINSEPSPAVQPDVLLDTYFTRCHGKAYYILDETTTRQRIQLNQIPSYLIYAIYAVSAR
jgi:hypothetical protein